MTFNIKDYLDSLSEDIEKININGINIHYFQKKKMITLNYIFNY